MQFRKKKSPVMVVSLQRKTPAASLGIRITGAILVFAVFALATLATMVAGKPSIATAQVAQPSGLKTQKLQLIRTGSGNVLTLSNSPRATATEEKAQEPTEAELLSLAAPRKGDGFERPIIRQLLAYPHLADNSKYQFTGNRADEAALKKWAGRTAHLMAIDHKFYGWKFGGQYRLYQTKPVTFVVQKTTTGMKIVVVAHGGNQLTAASQGSQIQMTTLHLVSPDEIDTGSSGAHQKIPTFLYLYNGVG